MGQILTYVGIFVAGFVIGGVLIYLINLRRWHTQDMDEVLGQLEVIAGNMRKLNANFRQGVERFGIHVGRMENFTSDVNTTMSRTELIVSQNVKGSAKAMEELAAAQAESAKILQEVMETSRKTEENAERILDTVKTLG